jgi:hypothetical protein
MLKWVPEKKLRFAEDLADWEEVPEKMVSRRAILSRSRDQLHLEEGQDTRDSVDTDQWFAKEKLYRDHIVEVLSKWDNIDDEIWAKVIVLERNRRVAKAYARAPVLTINGANDGFDGFRIGLNGFENPMRDSKTRDYKAQIGAGCKLKMDDSGNILVKRLAKSAIYVKNTIEENSVSNDILKLPGGLLEMEKPFKLFDMKKFQQNVNRELKRPYPERLKLESQCISTLALVRGETEVLDCPVWVMLINVVALEMLKAKMPQYTTSPSSGAKPGVQLKIHSASSDEDPYSLSPSGSSGSSGQGPRVGVESQGYFGPQSWAVSGQPVVEGRKKTTSRGRAKQGRKAEAVRQEDPYYHGLSARVPAFGGKHDRQRLELQELAQMKTPGRQAVSQGGPWWQERMYSADPSHPGKDRPQRNRLASPSRPTIFQGAWK